MHWSGYAPIFWKKYECACAFLCWCSRMSLMKRRWDMARDAHGRLEGTRFSDLLIFSFDENWHLVHFRKLIKIQAVTTQYLSIPIGGDFMIKSSQENKRSIPTERASPSFRECIFWERLMEINGPRPNFLSFMKFAAVDKDFYFFTLVVDIFAIWSTVVAAFYRLKLFRLYIRCSSSTIFLFLLVRLMGRGM